MCMYVCVIIICDNMCIINVIICNMCINMIMKINMYVCNM